MGRALLGRETDPGHTLNDPTSRAEDEARLVSYAYLVWPLAVFERIAPRREASAWYRFHMRQALWFGTLSALVTLAALGWPLILSFVVTDVVATLWIYGLAIAADLVLLVLWIVLALRYSRRAAQGELFDVAWVAKITGRWSHRP